MTFNEGDLVYLVYRDYGQTMRRAKVHRVTKTLAIVNDRGVEHKFGREDGRQRPRPSGYSFGASIEFPAPHLDEAYELQKWKRRATRLSDAAKEFAAGKMEARDIVTELCKQWVALS